MRWLKLTVTYDGGRYAGWQVQPQESTVQGVLVTVWQSITQETVRVTVAGRTDAGVHAIGQVVAVGPTSLLSNHDLRRALNAKLPDDIAVIAIDDAPPQFHATHDAISKLYRYQIHNSRIPTVFDRQFMWHVPQPRDAVCDIWGWFGCARRWWDGTIFPASNPVGHPALILSAPCFDSMSLANLPRCVTRLPSKLREMAFCTTWYVLSWVL